MKGLKGIIYAIISAITFGLIPLFAIPVQQGGNMDTLSILFYRFLFGAGIMGLLALVAGKSFKITLNELSVLSLFGLNYVITALGLLYSYNSVPSGIATTIHSLYPITVSLFSVIFLKEKIHKNFFVAVAISVVGVAMMCWSGGEASMIGMLIVFGTVITYTNYIILMSRAKVNHLDPMPLNFYILIFGAIFSFAISPLTESGSILPITTVIDFQNLILLALVPTVISNIMLIMAVKSTGATKTAIMGSFEPATAVLVGALYFHETITFTSIAGFVLIVISTVLVIMTAKRSTH